MVKYIITILLILFSLNASSRNFYFANSGNDLNTSTQAQSSSTPWQSINKLNSIFSTLTGGDSILFNRGDIFTGSIIATKSGNVGSPIVIGAYGVGNKPIISGFELLSGWINMGSNIWKCTPSISIKNNVNILTINGVALAKGRTPNSSYFVYQSATSNTLTSSVLSTLSIPNGAEIVMKKTSYTGEKGKITNISGNTATYSQTLGLDNGGLLGGANGTPNYGFFLQNYLGSLDQQGEWFYDSSSKVMYMYSTTNPSGFTINTSYVDTIINLNNRINITISDLDVEGAGMYGVEGSASSNSNVLVKNCSFNNNTRAVYAWNVDDIIVDNNYITNSFNAGIMISNNQRKRVTVTNNVILNTGQLIGMGLFWSDANLKGVTARTDSTTASNFVKVIGNTVRNSGHAAIQFQGSNVLIRRNIADTACNQLDDNGVIYTFTNNQKLNPVNFTNRVVDSNFIMNAIGAPDGANGIRDVAAAYCDEQAANILFLHNTVVNCPGPGFQLNSPHDISLIDNTVYNTASLPGAGTALVTINKYTHSEIYNNLVHRNILYQKDSSQINFWYAVADLSLPTPQTIGAGISAMADIDSNWISNQRFKGYGYNPPLTYIKLTDFQTTYGHDVHSVLPPIAVTQTNTRIITNITSAPLVTSFMGLRKVDPKGIVYNNSVITPPYSSTILIDNGSVNIPPTANAGADRSITLPTTSLTIVGSGTDVDGSIVAYGWNQISGPNLASGMPSSTATTTIGSMIQGTYTFRLKVTDNSGDTAVDFMNVVVNPSPNIPPVANAGTDSTITLPTNTCHLIGSGTDADGSVVSYHWDEFSGPSTYTINSPNTPSTLVSNLIQGTYQFRLIVVDNQGASDTDIVIITVNSAVIPPNIPPTCNAGGDRTITLPVNSVTITGTASDADGSIVSIGWQFIAGPLGSTINNSNTLSPTISNLVQGTYIYQLKVFDNSGDSAVNNMRILVNAAINIPPNANAGSNQTITLPTNSAILSGAASTDPDGSIVSWIWSQISGPSISTLVILTSSSVNATNLVQGIYIFRLKVTDNSGDTGIATVKVTVNASTPNIPPVAHAGVDQLIQLPTSTTTLTGSGTDADGIIVSYKWRIVSGSPIIVSPNNSTTNITGLVQGTFLFELTVKDNSGDSAKDTIQVVVNTPPVADAGPDRTITLPINSTTLVGTGSHDADGTIVSYRWSKTSGSGGIIVNANSVNTTLNFLSQGVYHFKLQVIDNNGGTSSSNVTVTVNRPRSGPIIIKGRKF